MNMATKLAYFSSACLPYKSTWALLLTKKHRFSWAKLGELMYFPLGSGIWKITLTFLTGTLKVKIWKALTPPLETFQQYLDWWCIVSSIVFWPLEAFLEAQYWESKFWLALNLVPTGLKVMILVKLVYVDLVSPVLWACTKYYIDHQSFLIFSLSLYVSLITFEVLGILISCALLNQCISLLFLVQVFCGSTCVLGRTLQNYKTVQIFSITGQLFEFPIPPLPWFLHRLDTLFNFKLVFSFLCCLPFSSSNYSLLSLSNLQKSLFFSVSTCSTASLSLN